LKVKELSIKDMMTQIEDLKIKLLTQKDTGTKGGKSL